MVRNYTPSLRRCNRGDVAGGTPNPKLQIPNPNHSQPPTSNSLPTPNYPIKSLFPNQLPIARELALGVGGWEWLGFGAWSLGFDEYHPHRVARGYRYRQVLL